MPLNPIKATHSIRKRYLDYLSTTFHLKDNDLQRQFRENLEIPGKFIKGPIIEATPPFETGSSINDLIDEGILSEQFRDLNSDRMPLDRYLYQHQETAIRKIIQHNRNLVVATGTGSGKTEAFLIPILNHLFKQKQDKILTPGVRALLLYPMNALANDQMMRMHELLKNYPHITFGRYTGETEKRNEAAESKYQKMYSKAPLKNELISREQMRANPPHILLTNYAMLEYLLLRPHDNVFFDGEYANNWKFIVIDEAHTYTGAKGIEMAMLLRRLKDRILESKSGRLRCVATSATIGNREDFLRIALFADRLFGEKFEWIDNNEGRQDVIEAVRKSVMNISNSTWGKPHKSLYSILLNLLDSNQISEMSSKIKQIAIDKDVPEAVIANIKSEDYKEGYKQLLYNILKGDQRVVKLQNLLEIKPQQLSDAAENIFGNTPDAEENLVALVDLSIHAKPGLDDTPLIPARYHVFVRAIEGAYITLQPSKKLYLERRENVDGNKIFEIAICRQCGSIYLVGEI
ncbi:DEAD/DEAH box helicase, partial [Candidatus Poribacteria bacterium]|nr:DEAD/DEAH box helicase [Candidatus Poribacteria bacterium]